MSCWAVDARDVELVDRDRAGAEDADAGRADVEVGSPKIHWSSSMAKAAVARAR